MKLVGEPWDIGPGGYQVGGFPPDWGEWNDKYRDTTRAYWKGEPGIIRDLAARITGSGDIYDLRGRRPWAGVNFLTAHDGFTLNDLVSYNEKHNEANGEDNNDGHGHNLSFNFGVEGPTDDPAIVALREQQKRNLLATLMLSQGTPMLLGGDEFGRTQRGNNNAYCQDNEVSWFDWEGITPKDRRLTAFVARLIALRKAHPVLRRSRFLHGREVSRNGVKDITWMSPKGGEMTLEEWRDPLTQCLGLMLNGKAGSYRTPDGQPADDDVLLIVMNAYHDIVPFRLPRISGGVGWRRCLDTTDPEPLPDPHPLRGRDNVILTPHAAWYSEQALVGLQAGAPAEVRRVLTGQWPVNVVNKAVRGKSRAGL